MDWQLNVLGYRYYKHDRNGDKSEGGVVFLIPENIRKILGGYSFGNVGRT